MTIPRLATLLVGTVVALGACASHTMAPTVSTEPDPGWTSPEDADLPMPSPLDASVTWSGITATPACFFFAGPGDLGRDDSYGDGAELYLREGSMAVLFSESTMFEGSLRDGDFDLERSATYDFHGAWRVEESLEGRVVDGAYEATYRYEECDLAHGVQGQGCPGRCTIEARVRIVPLVR